MGRGRQGRQRSEAGQASVLVVGFFVIAALLVVVVVDASAAYLRRQRLDSLADGAVLAAVDGIEADQVYGGRLDDRAELDPAGARQRVADYLREVGADRSLDSVTWAVRTTSDSVEVTVRAPMQLPLAPPGWGEGTTVTGAAAAHVEVTE